MAKTENTENEKAHEECCCDGHHHHHHRGGGGTGSAVYGLGFIGAAVYFIGQATTFQTGLIGFLKACVWPAFLVYNAFKLLH